MRCFIPILFVLLPFLSKAQVGIGTTKPKAQLDIAASNAGEPTAIDGILIPRITTFPATKPTADQHGMLVFLGKEKDNFPAGFYYWHKEDKDWKSITADAKAADFYKTGTNENAGNITEPIFRKGNLGIGTEELSSRLQIAINPNEDLSVKKGIEIDNNNSASDHLTTYGLNNQNRSSTNGTKYGIKTTVAGDGGGIHYGIHNVTNQNTGTNDIYGFYNRVGRTYGARSDNFGIFTEIGTSTGSGNIYGIYSVAHGDHNANVFAGYFVGRVGIGNSPNEDYALPATRGEDAQVLVTADNGEVSWKHPNTKNYSSTGGAAGNYVISDEVYSLRITNSPSSITIPDASSNRGRILVLIGWQGSGATDLRFMNGDTLFDLDTNEEITKISAKQILTIQSIGTRWLLLNK